MTGAQQGARDKAENDKGIPAHLTPLSFFIFLSLLLSELLKLLVLLLHPQSVLTNYPPIPSSSCPCINCEAEVIAVCEKVSGEESNEEDGDEGDEVDNRNYTLGND